MLMLVPVKEMSYESALEYYNSYNKTGRRDWVHFAVYEIGLGEKEYFDYITTYERNMYYLVDTDNATRILGAGSLNDFDCRGHIDIGNIGYEVRPDERCKGYGSTILTFLLEKCREEGRSWVCVSSEKGNIASQKIIENHGGIFSKEFYDEMEGPGRKYWIKVHPGIKNKVRRLIREAKKYKDSITG